MDEGNDEAVTIDCVNGRDCLTLDLSGRTAITLSLDDRRTTLASGATRLVFDEVGQLYDAIGSWLRRRGVATEFVAMHASDPIWSNGDLRDGARLLGDRIQVECNTCAGTAEQQVTLDDLRRLRDAVTAHLGETTRRSTPS
jgi:hypothetical protein